MDSQSNSSRIPYQANKIASPCEFLASDQHFDLLSLRQKDSFDSRTVSRTHESTHLKLGPIHSHLREFQSAVASRRFFS